MEPISDKYKTRNIFAQVLEYIKNLVWIKYACANM